MAHTMNRVTNARSLSRDAGVTYAAAHAAVDRLVGRGLTQRRPTAQLIIQGGLGVGRRIRDARGGEAGGP
jgi:hypothetical protein